MEWNIWLSGTLFHIFCLVSRRRCKLFYFPGQFLVQGFKTMKSRNHLIGTDWNIKLFGKKIVWRLSKYIADYFKSIMWVYIYICYIKCIPFTAVRSLENMSLICPFHPCFQPGKQRWSSYLYVCYSFFCVPMLSWPDSKVKCFLHR